MIAFGYDTIAFNSVIPGYTCSPMLDLHITMTNATTSSCRVHPATKVTNSQRLNFPLSSYVLIFPNNSCKI